jgi:hypothetical protein
MSTAPPFPEISRRPDGALAQTWEVSFESGPSGSFEQSALHIAKRALEIYDAQLTSQGYSELVGRSHNLHVSLSLLSTSTLNAQIISSGDAPNWNSAGAVTCVMAALEETYGAISQLNGESRSVWKLWPLPPNTSFERTREP